MDILIAENLKKYYETGQVTVKALDGINLSVKKGEFVAVVGTSGSGKSTLLHMLGGLDNPTSGRVIVGGLDISKMTKDGLVIGNEGEGVGRLVKEKCDMVAAIPMKGDIDSLNASVAAGVLAYEILRQRSIG